MQNNSVGVSRCAWRPTPQGNINCAASAILISSDLQIFLFYRLYRFYSTAFNYHRGNIFSFAVGIGAPKGQVTSEAACTAVGTGGNSPSQKPLSITLWLINLPPSHGHRRSLMHGDAIAAAVFTYSWEGGNEERLRLYWS